MFRGPRSDVQGAQYSKVQDIMGNGHMVTLEQNDKQTSVKNYLLATLLARGIHTASKPRPTLILIRYCTDFTSIKFWSVSVSVNAPFKK